MSTTVSVRLDDATINDLDMMAKAADRSRAWLMSQAISQYVEHEAWQVKAIKKALKKMDQGEARWAGHDEVTEWLASWGEENEGKGPQCR
ncbi:MAG: CopG family ribbon-helix-helix protein [Thermodesulfobacteriota bacterium]